jgi:hypothetical protein
MAFEFGFDVLRTDIEPVEMTVDAEDDDEGLPTFELLASSGDVSAHIFVDRDDMTWLIREIEAAEDADGARPGGPWEPQLPVMRGFFFHPRIRLAGGEVVAPGLLDDEDEPIEFWELRVEDEEGSEVILRLSETAMRGLLRQLREALAQAV